MVKWRLQELRLLTSSICPFGRALEDFVSELAFPKLRSLATPEHPSFSELRYRPIVTSYFESLKVGLHYSMLLVVCLATSKNRLQGLLPIRALRRRETSHRKPAGTTYWRGKNWCLRCLNRCETCISVLPFATIAPTFQRFFLKRRLVWQVSFNFYHNAAARVLTLNNLFNYLFCTNQRQHR